MVAPNHYYILDLLSKETLQSILNDFVETTGILVSAMDLQQNWLTIPGRSAIHCDMVQATAAGKEACAASDRALAAETARRRSYVVQRCHAGLCDLAAPILVEGEPVGYLVGGQMLASRLTEEEIKANIARLGVEEGPYLLALAQLPFLAQPRLEALARLLQTMFSAIAESAYQHKVQLARAEELALLNRSLSTPVIQVWDRVLALPLVGPVSEERARQVTEALLDGINRRRAEAVILDVTGVSVVDTQVVQSLLQAAQAASLLGATCIFSGIRAEVAQTVVALGLDLGAIPVCGNLQEAIYMALEIRNR